MGSGYFNRNTQTFWFEIKDTKFADVKAEFERLLHIPNEQIIIGEVHVWKDDKGLKPQLQIRVKRYPTETEEKLGYGVSSRTYSYDYNATKQEDIRSIIDEIFARIKEEIATPEGIAAKCKNRIVNPTAVVAEEHGSLEDYLQNGDHWRGKWDIRE